MADTSEFAGRCALAASLLTASIGMGACATTMRVDDLQFVSLRKVTGQSLSRQQFKAINRLIDDQMIEATLSTSADLVAAVNGKDNWAPYARKWLCTLGGNDDFPLYMYDIYENGKRVRPLTSQWPGQDEIAQPSKQRSERHYYTVYFPVRAASEDGGALGPTRSAYDLERTPADVCVEFGTAGYYNSVSLETNVVTIPAGAVEAVLSGGHR